MRKRQTRHVTELTNKKWDRACPRPNGRPLWTMLLPFGCRHNAFQGGMAAISSEKTPLFQLGFSAMYPNSLRAFPYSLRTNGRSLQTMLLYNVSAHCTPFARVIFLKYGMALKKQLETLVY